MRKKKTENRKQKTEFRAIGVEENYFESQAFFFGLSNHSWAQQSRKAGAACFPSATAQF
jgi:hypothetical protein